MNSVFNNIKLLQQVKPISGADARNRYLDYVVKQRHVVQSVKEIADNIEGGLSMAVPIKPVEGCIVIQPIAEQEAVVGGIIVAKYSTDQDKYRTAKVVAVPDHSDLGVTAGDVVVYEYDKEYNTTVPGYTDYEVISVDTVVAIINS